MSDQNKRLILAFALIIGIWAVFQHFFPGPKPADEKTTTGAPAQSEPARSPGTATAPGGDAGGDAGAAGAASGAGTATTAAQGAAQPAAVAPERAAIAQSNLWRAELTTSGAALKSYVLLHPRYQEERDGKTVPIDLVQAGEPYPLSTDFGAIDFALPWTLEQQDRYTWKFSKENAGARMEKTYTFDPRTHVARLKVRVENRAPKPSATRLTIYVHGREDPNAKAPGFFNPNPRQWSVACYVSGTLERNHHSDLEKEDAFLGDVRWAGVDDQYFLLAVAPVDETDPRRCVHRAGPNGRLTVALELSEHVLAAAGAAPSNQGAASSVFERELLIYAGPKSLHDLDAVAAGKQPIELGKAVDYGWLAIICRPMLWLLTLFHGWAGNWGVAIILLTLVVKLVTIYPTQKSMRSMKNMQKIQPDLKRLQEKYKDNKDRLNQEIMNLYKRHGVNPLAGCLPMLLQMPIWFALYKTISQSVELYRSSFGLWIIDLAKPDRYFLLPIMLGILSFGQSWMQMRQSATTDPQQKMMMWMFPGMFLMMSLFVPAGLTLYWLINTVLTMVHQWLMNRADKPAAATT